MRVHFHPAAYEELREAVAYYNTQGGRLSHAFAVEVERTLERILLYPHAWARSTPRARRCLLRRFPYAIVYQLRAGTVLVVAVMHLRRKPGYWQGRLQRRE
jgi:plasmid stabilization system protein ParE